MYYIICNLVYNPRTFNNMNSMLIWYVDVCFICDLLDEHGLVINRYTTFMGINV